MFSRKRRRGAGEIDLHGVIDDEIDRHERLDDFRIAAQSLHRAAHRREIDHQRHAGKILEDNARDDEGNFLVRRRLRVPVGERLDIFAPDLFAVAIAQDRFENNADADRQPRDRADALFLERGKGMKRCFAPVAGIEFLSVLNSLGILIRHFPSDTEGSLDSRRGREGHAAEFLDFARDDGGEGRHVNSASFALILSKSGSSRASSCTSAYWMTPPRSMRKAERLATPAKPRFSCGRNDS